MRIAMFLNFHHILKYFLLNNFDKCYYRSYFQMNMWLGEAGPNLSVEFLQA